MQRYSFNSSINRAGPHTGSVFNSLEWSEKITMPRKTIWSQWKKTGYAWKYVCSTYINSSHSFLHFSTLGMQKPRAASMVVQYANIPSANKQAYPIRVLTLPSCATAGTCRQLQALLTTSCNQQSPVSI